MDYFCMLCDKSVKLRHKNKHLNTNKHRALSDSIITRYHIENPGFFEIEYILDKCIDDYDKKFRLCIIICKWKLKFTNITFHVKSERMFIVGKCCLKKYLLSKIDYFTSSEYKFSHISEMTITFIT